MLVLFTIFKNVFGEISTPTPPVLYLRVTIQVKLRLESRLDLGSGIELRIGCKFCEAK